MKPKRGQIVHLVPFPFWEVRAKTGAAVDLILSYLSWSRISHVNANLGPRAGIWKSRVFPTVFSSTLTLLLRIIALNAPTLAAVLAFLVFFLFVFLDSHFGGLC